MAVFVLGWGKSGRGGCRRLSRRLLLCSDPACAGLAKRFRVPCGVSGQISQIAILNAHSYTQEYEHAHTHTHTFLGRTRNHARPHARKPALGKTKAPADIAGNNGVPNTRFRRRSSTGTRWSSPRAAGTSLCRSRSAPAAFRARWMSGARAAEPRQRHFAAQRRHQCRAARKMGALRWRCGTWRWSAVAARRSTRRSASTGWRW